MNASGLSPVSLETGVSHGGDSRDGGERAGAAFSGKRRFRLSRHQRLQKHSEFQDAFNQGPATPGRYMVMWRRRGPGAHLRLGVVVSKRTLRRAVDRARAKRMLREAYRLNRHRFSGDYDVLLVVRRSLLRATYGAIERDLLKLARRTGLMAGATPTTGRNASTR